MTAAGAPTRSETEDTTWVNRARDGELDELYDLDRDPYEIINVIRKPAYRAVRDRLRRELQRLAAAALGL
jgi:Domain of unknown function (DUF4976)